VTNRVVSSGALAFVEAALSAARNFRVDVLEGVADWQRRDELVRVVEAALSEAGDFRVDVLESVAEDGRQCGDEPHGVVEAARPEAFNFGSWVG
jgi:hypothetical protein